MQKVSYMLRFVSGKLRHLFSRIRWMIWRPPRSRVIIKRFGKKNSKGQPKGEPGTKNSTVHLKSQLGHSVSDRPIRIATFNVAMFSLAPAVSKTEESVVFSHKEENFVMCKSPDIENPPKSILKQSPLHAALTNPEHLRKQKKLARSKRKVSINLPDNEISLANSKLLSSAEDEEDGSSNITGRNNRSNPMRSPVCLPACMTISYENYDSLGNGRSILEVLREVDADILALQDVKAEEERGMKPLSDLAAALGMKYIFAESWAPEYGNAVLSKWPIRRWKVQKIVDDDDFRNLIKVTVDVPWTGEVNFYCTQLDHLDENWRMNQINAILRSNDSPHILAGGLNSLDGSDYSSERWMNIVKYYEEIGKPSPKVEVMKYLKSKGYVDAKNCAGECEPAVIIAKGQNVQGTCKYGTRVDNILGSVDSPYKFVPGSYSVISSKDDGYPIPWRLVGNIMNTEPETAPTTGGNTISSIFSVDSKLG